MTLYERDPEKRLHNIDPIRGLFDRICDAYLAHENEPSRLRDAYEQLARDLWQYIPNSVDSVDFRFSGQEGGNYVFYRKGYPSGASGAATLVSIDAYRDAFRPRYGGAGDTAREDYFKSDENRYPLPPSPQQIETPKE